ncbi:Uncharacterized membrane protein [Cohaesibacter sp. ES.047]|uniref:DUF2254 domain-containing protein n=1 Tax=Cohaesibacter sp. ES.047 TaxID=1798205 RepID=UPI000BB7AB52|nr:DUF2254 domain-containing protein [Cohaesibacter sp. ES.047]SNY90197.1 Uncharacterized membrane protein [Cohaesibacter sp. ES.047]
MSKWHWILLQFTRRLWVRAALIGFLGICAAGLASLVDELPTLPIKFDIGADAIENILTIIASSMLTVTTFSLSVMTAAFNTATSNATPRATRLLIEDHSSQNALSSFIGSFLFSMVGLVVLNAGAYGPQGRIVLFAVTVLVIALVVLSLLRWIDYLTKLGRVEEAADRVEQATKNAMLTRLAAPYLGGRALLDEDAIPAWAIGIFSESTGYIQHVDLQRLSNCATEAGGEIFLAATPGTFVFLNTNLAYITLDASKKDKENIEHFRAAVQNAITIGNERNFDQDPRFGLCVLSEIAIRALSPGVNDPGTAIDIIGRQARLLTLWSQKQQSNDADHDSDSDDVSFPNIHVPPLRSVDLFDDSFHLIARDGAGQVEVQMRLRKVLKALSEIGENAFSAAAHNQAAIALVHAESSLTLEEDKDRVRAITF